MMKFPNQTKIQAFNFLGTLNNAFGKSKPTFKVERLRLPQRIVELDFKRGTTKEESSGSLPELFEVMNEFGVWPRPFLSAERFEVNTGASETRSSVGNL